MMTQIQMTHSFQPHCFIYEKKNIHTIRKNKLIQSLKIIMKAQATLAIQIFYEVSKRWFYT